MKKEQNFLLFVSLAALVILALTLPSLLPMDKAEAEKTFVASGHPEWAPFMWREGETIVGAGPQLAQKIFNDLGLKLDVKYAGSWEEAQAKAKAGEVDMLVAAYKTAERENYYDFSEGYAVDPIALFIKKGKKFKYSKWDDLKNKKGVAMAGDSYGQEFDNYIAENLKVERVATATDAFQLIETGKADYFIYAHYAGERAIKAVELAGKYQSVKPYVASENFYFAISKKSPLIKYLPQINELVKAYRDDRTVEGLINQNQ